LRKIIILLVIGSALAVDGQVIPPSGGTPDSGFIAPTQTKPGFLSLFNTESTEPQDSNGSVIDSIAVLDSLNVLSKAPASKKVKTSSLPGLTTTPEIYYRTTVLNEEKKRIERAIEKYLQPTSFSVSVRKITGYTENFNVANNSLPGVLNVVKKQMPQIVSQRKEITLDIDTATSQGNYAFFKNLINSVVNIDESDIVEIKFWEFPNTAKEKLAERKLYNGIKPLRDNVSRDTVVDPPTDEQGLLLNELLQRLDEDAQLDTSAPTSQSTLPNTVEPKSEEFPWLTVILSALLFFAMVAIILMLVFGRRKKPVKVEEEALEVTNMGLKKIAEGAFEDNRPSMKKDEFKVHLLENPEAVAAFLSSTIEQNNDEALTVFAHLAKPFPDLVAMTKPFLPYNSFLTVLSKLDSPLDEKIDPQSIDKFLVTFNSAIKVLSKRDDNEVEFKGGKVFGFLEQLSDPQISSLLTRDKPEIASVVFAQLNKDRKLSVLNSLETEFRNNLLIALSDIKSMPLSVIKEIGIRYSKKAREVAGLEDINIDGLIALVETLDELDLAKQVEIVDTMRANDLSKGERLEKIFIGMPGLINVSQDILRNALSEIETDVMIKSLYGLDEAVIEHVLVARPPRERELIKAEISAITGVGQGEQIATRKRVLSSVRKFL
jgi:hypothetical protein